MALTYQIDDTQLLQDIFSNFMAKQNETGVSNQSTGIIDSNLNNFSCNYPIPRSNENKRDRPRNNRQDSRLRSVIAFDDLVGGRISKQKFLSDREKEFGLQKLFIDMDKKNGVKNSVFIPKGAIVLLFDGEYRSCAEAKLLQNRYLESREGTYMLNLASEIILEGSPHQVHVGAIDPTIRRDLSIEEYSLGRYFNDAASSDPNCNIELFGQRSQNRRDYYIAMKAKRDIAINEELMFDYGDRVFGSLYWRNMIKPKIRRKKQKTRCAENNTEDTNEIINYENKCDDIGNNAAVEIINYENKYDDINDNAAFDSDVDMIIHLSENNCGSILDSPLNDSTKPFCKSPNDVTVFGSSSSCSHSISQLWDELHGFQLKKRNKEEVSATQAHRKRKFELRIARKLSAPLVYSNSPAKTCCTRFKCSTKTKLFTSTALSDCRMALHSLVSSVDQREFIDKLQRTDFSGNSHPTVLNEPVCFAFFCFVYQTSSNRLAKIRKLADRQRKVRDADAPMEESILRWLDEFALFHEIMPNTKFIQLPYSSRSIVANFYLEDCLDNPMQYQRTSISYFLNTWKQKRSNIILRKHLQFALCDTCIGLRVKRNNTIDAQQLTNQKLQLREHLEFIKTERQYYDNKKASAKVKPKEYLSIILDGADQSAYAMPHFADITKKTQTAHKQKCHLIGVLVHSRAAYLYTCTDKWAHDSNLTIELLQRTLRDVERQSTNLPPILYLQMDNCWRENKNRYVLGYLSWLVMRAVFREIYCSFLPVGHTHTDIDQLFSRTSFCLKGTDARCRDELYEVVQNCYHPTPKTQHIEVTANIRGWFEENHYLNKMENHSEPRHFKICPSADSINDIQAVIWTKMGSGDDWIPHNGKNNTRDGFALLKKTTPLFIEKLTDVPKAVPKGCDDDVWNKLESGLNACKPRLSDNEYKQNLKDLHDLRDTTPYEFHWQDKGQFACELRIAAKKRAYGLRSNNNDNDVEMDCDDDYVHEDCDFEELQRGELLSKASEKFGNFSMKYLTNADFVIVGATLDERNTQRFWVAKVIKQFTDEKGKQMLKIHWHQADKEFGAYYPSLVNGGEDYFDSLPRGKCYLRFPQLHKTFKLPTAVVNVLKNKTPVFDPII